MDTKEIEKLMLSVQKPGRYSGGEQGSVYKDKKDKITFKDVAGADEEKLRAAEIYAESIGLAFQIVDDLLDITSTSEELGKPVGSDEVNSKSTYPSILGLERSKELVNELTERAVSAVSVLGDESKFLSDYAVKLSVRTK